MTSAEEKANTPGLALIIVGVLTILTGLALAGSNIVGLVLGVLEADDAVSFLMISLNQVVSALWNLGGAVAGVIIAMGGNKLRSLESAGMVYAGAIMALVPCCSGPCCCIGLPIGIWAIVTMQDDEVKAAFDG